MRQPSPESSESLGKKVEPRHSIQFSNNPSQVQESNKKVKTTVDYNYSSDDDFDLGVESLDFNKDKVGDSVSLVMANMNKL